ncbi:chorismate mutase [Plantactinospora sp. KBS50]|uniref:chorismate mutase n=1 Tax=Plantactinospora sp. KBS50 TaxID=2024580 RepID=UPI000BAA9AD6|nr:chorismate mutase [Plantactinospora sp. KBS50]ASW53635.1 chorismate mutase [Plantactinospora sp. KBS50]
MPTHLADQESDSAAPAAQSPSAPSAPSAPPAPASTGTGAASPAAAEHITALRERIDEIDAALIALWQERAQLSQQVGATRVASGGTRLVLARERQVLDRFRDALGADGTQLGLLLLRAGRGPL